MTRATTLICLLLCGAASDAGAQPAPIRLSLADAIARGQENSHRIAEAKAREEGAKAAATTASLADRPNLSASGGYTRRGGLDIPAMRQYANKHPRRLLEGYDAPGMERLTNSELLEIPCDVLVPAALVLLATLPAGT